MNMTSTNSTPYKDIHLECNNGKSFKSVSGKVVNGKQITDYNSFDEKEKVYIKNFEVKRSNDKDLDLLIPAHSIILIQLYLD